MFLRVALGWLSHGPKEMDDLAFEFQKASYGTSFRKPRLVSSCLNIQIMLSKYLPILRNTRPQSKVSVCSVDSTFWSSSNLSPISLLMPKIKIRKNHKSS